MFSIVPARLLLGAALALASTSACALILYPLGSTPVNQWVAICNDGAIFGPYTDYGMASALGGIACDGHGGIADVSDGAIENALQLATCQADSSVTLAREDAVGGFEALTLAQVAALLDDHGGEVRELAGVRMRSLVIRGRELLPAPIADPSPIALSEIHSDENEDGTFVGGTTSCALPAARAVPLPLAGATLFAMALMTAAIHLRTRSRG